MTDVADAWLSGRVKLLASTGDIACDSAEKRHASSSRSSKASTPCASSDDASSDSDASSSPGSAAKTEHGLDADLNGYFETAQWTADGTTVLAYTSTRQVRGYVVPSDLLEPRPSPISLTPPQSVLQLPEPSNALAAAPYFSLSEPWTNQLLVSSRDHPIQLYYLFGGGGGGGSTSKTHNNSPASSYPLTASPRSETFLSAASLLWTYPGTHFVAGTRNLLARYDVSRPGSDGPVTRVKTIPSERHLSKGGGVGMRGTVSALSAQFPSSDNGGGSLVAAGTWTRWVGLYDFAASDPAVANWCIREAADTYSFPSSSPSSSSSSSSAPDSGGAGGERRHGPIGGNGITQTLWSPCGRYLVVSERRARGLLVYDVRVTGRLLGVCCGLPADGGNNSNNTRTGGSSSSSSSSGNQKILCDVFPSSSSGFEIWCGGAAGDGFVRVWEGVGTQEGAHEPAWGWRAHGGGDDDDNRDATTIGSTCVHPSGSVVATCSGAWGFAADRSTGSRSSGSATSSYGTSSDRDDDTGSSGSSEASEIAWLRRRNKESSLRIWGIGGGEIHEEDEWHGSKDRDRDLE